jgi:hypothetical protein
MVRTGRLIVALVWGASLLGVAVWAQAGRGADREVPMTQYGDAIGPVISGDNIGFQRVAAPGASAGKVVGKLMVRVNGQWLETAAPIVNVR